MSHTDEVKQAALAAVKAVNWARETDTIEDLMLEPRTMYDLFLEGYDYRDYEATAAAAAAPVAGSRGEGGGQMSAAETSYFARLSSLEPAALLTEWEETEEASHLEPAGYKPEYVKLLLAALRAALSPATPEAAAAAVPQWLDPNRGPRSEWEGNTQILRTVLVAREGANEAEPGYYCDIEEEWYSFRSGERERIYDVEGWMPLPALPAAPATEERSEPRV